MRHYIFAFLLSLIAISCSRNVEISKHIDAQPEIFPDYKDVTVPKNICPLVFTLADSVSDMQAVFESGSTSVTVDASDGQIAIDANDWASIVGASNKLTVRMREEKDGVWAEYKPFTIEISDDAIDPYMAYRLIEPGYEVWNEMGIYQRCVENYDEEPIITNRTTQNNCMNCHSFCKQSPDTMVFHMRKEQGGTYFKKGSDFVLSDCSKTPEGNVFVYPYWHPSGDFVAFSTNTTKQMFHTSDLNRIEVFDYKSDVIVYDVKDNKVLTSDLITTQEHFETFPCFSPDGKTLYFCCADSVTMPLEFEKAHYSLCSIAFDAESKSFGEKVDTLIDVNKIAQTLPKDSLEKNDSTLGASISFPRVSPDGRFLIFTLSNYGNFSIWHREARLYIMDLQDKEKKFQKIEAADIHASYHSWSSNSRWLVFSSRSLDGLYTRPFLMHIGSDGKISKPFLLPQKDVRYYDRLMKSFNVPELVKGRVE